ncbi:MAG: amidohydrolase family protein [Candidatus Hydrothermarchaeota archaeon]
MKKILFIVLAILIFCLLIFAENSNIILIKNVTIIPVTSGKIEGGSLLIKNGKIAGLGKEIEEPPGAKVIDASGMFIYPGFIDGFTRLGLSEIYAIPSTVDVRELGQYNPELQAAWAINPHSVHFANSRINGTTAALVAPSGGIFPGLSALVKMDGWTFPEMAVKEVATSLINFPITPKPPRGVRLAPKEKAKKEVTSKLVEKIKKYLKQARRYFELKKIAASNPKISPPETNLKFEALEPVLNGTLPVIISVEKAKDIELAIKFVQEEKLKAIFRGCAQGYKVADKIKESGIPVILNDLYADPAEPEDGYDAPFRNVVELAETGVLFCFSSGGNPAIAKDLPYHAARAIAFGLSHKEAIKALTINPAKILGVDDRLGSLEVGKDADLFICTGDPLDLRNEVTRLFINGKEVDLSNWWTELEKKWAQRPKN